MIHKENLICVKLIYSETCNYDSEEMILFTHTYYFIYGNYFISTYYLWSTSEKVPLMTVLIEIMSTYTALYIQYV